MFEVYFPLAALIIIGGVIACAMVVLSLIIGKKSPNPAKAETYECGMIPVGDARGRFSVKFYLIAILFIIFDIEVVFLYPWAVIYRQLAWFGLIEMGVFILILLVGYFYIVKKGALKWD